MVGIAVISGRETAAQAPEFPLDWVFCLEPGPGGKNRLNPGKSRSVAQTDCLAASGQVSVGKRWFGLRPLSVCLFLCPQAYNIHVNGVLHCRVRYSQLLGLHEQVGLAPRYRRSFKPFHSYYSYIIPMSPFFFSFLSSTFPLT